MCKETIFNLSAMVRSQASWSKVARKLYIHLSKFCHVNLVEQKGFLYSENKKNIFNIPENKNDEVGDIDIIFDHPENIKHKGVGKKKVYHFVYEFDFLSQDWIDNINSYADIIWVPNKFNLKILKKNNVHKPIIIVPYGTEQKKKKFDEVGIKKRFNERPFIFLSILMPQKRKGIDELLKAFSYEFKDERDVILKIKIPYSKQKCIWDMNIQGLIKKYSNFDNIIFDDTPMTDSEILRLIEECRLYLQPSISEGFGLSVLDSLMSGIPVMVNDYGAQLEFSSDRKGMIVLNSKIKKMKNILYSDPEKEIEVFVPKVKDIRKKMRMFISDFDYFSSLYEEIDVNEEVYSWDYCAKELLKKIKILDARN